MQCRERVRTLYQSKDPNPKQPTHGRKKKIKQLETKKKEQIMPTGNIGSALETRQSHTIKHRVTKIRPKRHREGHKGSAIMRSPTTRRRERVPMSNQSTTSNTRWHIRQIQCTAQRTHWVTLNRKWHEQLCYRSTMSKVAV